MNDIQDDQDNIFGIVFFKRDDTDFDLTKRNKDILEGLRRVADKKAVKITDDKIKYLYFSRVDLSVPENKRLWERFGLNNTSCDKYPVAAVMRNAKGSRIDGPAVISLFSKNIDKAAGLAQPAGGAQAGGCAAADPTKCTDEASCKGATGKWDAAGKKCTK